MAENTPQVYQFKIILNVRNQVWRRIQIAENSTFKDLHFALQRAMGWDSSEIMYHLHKFELTNPKTKKKDTIGIRFEDDDGIFNTLAHETVKIADYFIPPKYVTARYEYDFGIGWNHDIILEEILPAKPGTTYPQCIDGKWPCPPEDGVYHGDVPKVFDPKSVDFEPHLNLPEDSP